MPNPGSVGAVPVTRRNSELFGEAMIGLSGTKAFVGDVCADV
jgi:hypothetical protein